MHRQNRFPIELISLYCLTFVTIHVTDAATVISSNIAQESVHYEEDSLVIPEERVKFVSSEELETFVIESENGPQGSKQSNYSAYWNTPTESCKSDFGVDVDPRNFGIEENKLNGWIGEKMTIFYARDLGYYPEIERNGRIINGGIPQLGNYEAHLEKAAHDIQRYIPQRSFSGLGILDWEKWTPVWERNTAFKKPYMELSIALVKLQHPNWPEKKLEAEAKVQFETEAKRWMIGTLQLAQSLRPNGRWGYYLFPKCYNKVTKSCPKKEMQLNDQLLWLFKESSALFPSAYLKDSSLTLNQKKNLVHGRVSEALRIQSLVKTQYNKTVPVYLYNRFRYLDDSLYSKDDILATVAQPKTMGAQGTLLWDTHTLAENKTICQRMKQYVDNTLGPTVRSILG